MPTTRRQRTIRASAEELWEVVRDPHHLPRWWPRVARVEAVDGDAFTEVLKTAKGKFVRADFTLVAADDARRRLTWAQQLEGSPFARLLSAAETEVRLTPEGGATLTPEGEATLTPEGEVTVVTLELRQQLTGVFPRFGAYLVRRAAAATLDEALDGLERISVADPTANDA